MVILNWKIVTNLKHTGAWMCTMW